MHRNKRLSPPRMSSQIQRVMKTPAGIKSRPGRANMRPLGNTQVCMMNRMRQAEAPITLRGTDAY